MIKINKEAQEIPWWNQNLKIWEHQCIRIIWTKKIVKEKEKKTICIKKYSKLVPKLVVQKALHNLKKKKSPIIKNDYLL